MMQLINDNAKVKSQSLSIDDSDIAFNLYVSCIPKGTMLRVIASQEGRYIEFDGSIITKSKYITTLSGGLSFK